jgi:hypothetical protein
MILSHLCDADYDGKREYFDFPQTWYDMRTCNQGIAFICLTINPNVHRCEMRSDILTSQGDVINPFGDPQAYERSASWRFTPEQEIREILSVICQRFNEIFGTGRDTMRARNDDLLFIRMFSDYPGENRVFSTKINMKRFVRQYPSSRIL